MKRPHAAPLTAVALISCVLSAAPAFATTNFATAQSAAKGLEYLSQLNVIVFGDMNAAHDVEGKTWVGGNLNGNSFTAGIGNANQSAKSSAHATLTVGGNNNVGSVNLNNGANGRNGAVATNYGMTVAGNSKAFNLNGDGATVKIGGNADFDLNVGSSSRSPVAANVSISGFVRSVTATADGSIVRVGSVSGGKVQVGNNATVTVGSGNVAGDVTAGNGSTVRINGGITNNGKLQVGNTSTVVIRDGVASEVRVGSGSNAQIGGSIGGNTTVVAGTSGGKTVLAVGGNTNLINGSSHNLITVGGNVNGNASIGADSLLTVRGRLNSDLQVNGGNSNTVVRLGSYGGNSNPLNGGANVYVSTSGQNKTGWSFSENYAKPDAPAAIASNDLAAAPAAPDVATTTSAMLTSLRDLSSHLAGMSATKGNSIATSLVGGSTYDWTFNVTATTDGAAVFNVDGSQLFDRIGGAAGSVRNIDFNLNGLSDASIIINVTGLDAGSWKWDLGNGSGYTSALNQKVIWNFADATGSLNFTTLVHGSVLATEATISNTTPIEGSVVAKVFNQGGEVHLGTFDGDGRFLAAPDGGSGPAPAVPEPASWATMLAGFGMIGGAIRRRRRQVAVAA
jgi:choice-of-anchor A domain-containing protein